MKNLMNFGVGLLVGLIAVGFAFNFIGVVFYCIDNPKAIETIAVGLAIKAIALTLGACAFGCSLWLDDGKDDRCNDY